MVAQTGFLTLVCRLNDRRPAKDITNVVYESRLLLWQFHPEMECRFSLHFKATAHDVLQPSFTLTAKWMKQCGHRAYIVISSTLTSGDLFVLSFLILS